jgi:hypothetical protein
MNPQYSIGQDVKCNYDGESLYGRIKLIRSLGSGAFDYFIDPSPGAMHLYEYIWVESEGETMCVAGHWIHQDDVIEIWKR